MIGQLTPDVIEQKDALVQAALMGSVNRIGKIDLLARVPNSDDCSSCALSTACTSSIPGAK